MVTRNAVNTVRASLMVLATSVLVACGGGGSGVVSGSGASPTVSVANVSKLEGTGGTNSLDFTVTLSAAAATDVTVDYSTVNGTAVGGDACDSASAAVDYVRASGTLTIPAGMTSGTVTVDICPDGELEAGDETFTLALANISANATLAPATTAATILNDDAMALNDTQNGWYTNTGPFNPISDNFWDFPRQDGFLGRDTANASLGWADGWGGFSFTKLGAAGKPLAVQDQAFDNANGSEAAGTRWDCVLDNVTGLVWETKTSDGGFHDTNNTYYLEGTDAPQRADNYVAAANGTLLCGHSDWRLPSRQELQSIVSHTNTGGAYVELNFMPNTGSVVYWSTTADASDATRAWSVNFGYFGADSSDQKTASAHLLLVRGGVAVPTPRFVAHSDGTATDTWTGLMWKRCPEGHDLVDNNTPADFTDDMCIETGMVGFSWQGALLGSEASNFAGYKDWHVPNIKELQSLVDSSRSSPAMDTAVFPNIISTAFWSSTTPPIQVLGDNAELVLFDTGRTAISTKTSGAYVRLVR